MTRVNTVPVIELSDPHLKAEWNEICRCVKRDYDLTDAPDVYTLGKGHVKWARKHARYCFKRYFELADEMSYRGFKINFSPVDLLNRYRNTYINSLDYTVTDADLEINRARITERYLRKPSWYKWTKREKPVYLKGLD